MSILSKLRGRFKGAEQDIFKVASTIAHDATHWVADVVDQLEHATSLVEQHVIPTAEKDIAAAEAAIAKAEHSIAAAESFIATHKATIERLGALLGTATGTALEVAG